MDDLLRFSLCLQRIGCLIERASGRRRRLSPGRRMAARQGIFAAVPDAVAGQLGKAVHGCKVFFEKRDMLHVSTIRGVLERTGIGDGGGDDCLQKPTAPSLSNRLWPETLAARQGWVDACAKHSNQLVDIRPSEVNQCGPAARLDRASKMHTRVMTWMNADLAGACAR